MQLVGGELSNLGKGKGGGSFGAIYVLLCVILEGAEGHCRSLALNGHM